MLRVGLTGELGSGKSTVARLLATQGAIILSSDDMGRQLMQPGERVYQMIVDQFGPSIVGSDGTLDRRALAALAFDPAQPRVEELNALIHPAVIAAQEQRLAELARDAPDAIVVIESALLFTTKHASGIASWHNRFDAILLVTAPDEVKIRRFVERAAGDHALTPAERAALVSDAEHRLATQRIPPEAVAHCLVIENTGDLTALQTRTEEIFLQLRRQRDDVQG